MNFSEINLSKLSDRIIAWGFYALFFFVPLAFTPYNYELFEYNKMMATYGFAIIIAFGWIAKMVVHKKVIFRRTPLDIPLMLFLITQVASTIFSIDPHVSIWGYYSRFHGGLLSTVSYITLFYAFVTNMTTEEKIKRLFKVILVSATLVATYAVLERLGIDKQYWVQDVQNRVFSTFGQPNWLAAYMAILLPISLAKAINHLTTWPFSAKGRSALGGNNSSNKIKLKLTTIASLILPFLFYITLLFTKSRSGFIAFWIANGVFWALIFLTEKRTSRKTIWSFNHFQPKADRPLAEAIKLFLIFNFSFLIFTFVFGTPFSQVNKFTLPNFLPKQEVTQAEATAAAQVSQSTELINVGVTESGDIRKIVWQGALSIARQFPLFGTGVETFAYAYYKYRPVEHNLTSEWDFIYNKAHNEYLNFAATSGFVGLGSYLLFIVWFIIWNVKSIKRKNNTNQKYLLLPALLASWLSILITNFFGFSVVIVGLFFFLIPAIAVSLSFQSTVLPDTPKALSNLQKVALIAISCFTFYFSFLILKYWYADTVFARGNRLTRSSYYFQAYPLLKAATQLNSGEPLYHDKLAATSAVLAKASFEQKDATSAAEFSREAIQESEKALSTSPQNITFWKTRTRVFVTLAEILDKDELARNPDGTGFTQQALDAILVARELAPTDPKIAYNAALLHSRVGEIDKAIELLENTKKLKPDFRDAYYGLALFYKEEGNLDATRTNLEFILNHINPEDTEVKSLLEQVK